MKALSFPNNIQIETTSRCNAHCQFCPYPETSKTQPSGVMDDDLFGSIVEQISRHQVLLIQPFLNNDPLMDPQMIPRLETIIRSNPRARVRVTTNGSLLREDIARALAAMPLEFIFISSNGLTADTYRTTMGLDGYTVLRNVNYLWDELRRRGSATKLVVTSIVMRSNQHEIVHMRDYWQSRGVTFYVNPLNNRAGNIAPERFNELLPFRREVNRTQLHHWPMTSCATLFSYMGILWNGDLITCCMDWRRARVLGNAREESLENLWSGPRYEALRALSNAGRLNELPLCDECGENRFSVDPDALADWLAQQDDDDPVQRSDRELLALLRTMREETPELIQLGLVSQARNAG